MIDILWLNDLFPLVATLIEQIQTTTGVFQSYARTAAIFGGLGVVGVVAGEDECIVLLCQTDVDDGWSIAVHAMLKGILDEGYK